MGWKEITALDLVKCLGGFIFCIIIVGGILSVLIPFIVFAILKELFVPVFTLFDGKPVGR